jgi:predicted RNase H-like HicB family nuclease
MAIGEKNKLDYMYFEADEGGYVGYFKDFPQHVTQGETIEELEEMLLDLFNCLHLSKYHTRELAIA